MSICVNHTSRTATTRCSSCHKPICDDCVIKANGSVFCSQKCVEGAARFANFNAHGGPGFFTKLKNTIVGLVGLVVVLAVGVFICGRFLHVGFCNDLLKLFGL